MHVFPFLPSSISPPFVMPRLDRGIFFFAAEKIARSGAGNDEC
jgi:hypothetical protein